MSPLRIRATVALVGAAGAALFAVVLPPLGDAPASATHPCGSSSAGTFDPDPSADHDACSGSIRPAPAVGSEVVLTLADNGRTVTLALGQRLRAELQSYGSDIWPDITAENALHRYRFAVQPDRSIAGFTALSPTTGQQVAATSESGCLHAQPACAVPQRQWQVTVVVEDRPDAGPSPSPQGCTRVATPSVGPDTVLLEEASDGQTVRVQRGQRVEVVFSGCKDGGADYQPAVGGGPLFRETATGFNPGGAVSWFRALANGTTTVTATLDAPCLHQPGGCAVLARVWSATVEVVEPRPCELTGPYLVDPGATVRLSGRVDPGAAVRLWFQTGGTGDFAVRRTLTAASDGSFATSYAALADQRWYATADGGCTTATGQTNVQPAVSAPSSAVRGETVRVVVRGAAGAAVRLFMRYPGGDFVPRRTGRIDAAGFFRTSYVARTDERYYAVTDPGGRVSVRALTQIR